MHLFCSFFCSSTFGAPHRIFFFKKTLVCLRDTDESVSKEFDIFHVRRSTLDGKKVEAAVKSPKPGKSAGIDNIPAELIREGGETMDDALLNICTLSLVIALLKAT